uniref:protochlorophyllide reductase subunit B n=1 Tax=Chlorococcum tatrense TaxID=915274 RepID=UPI0010C485D2|nr:protochlorophyllide reductase subunit B [Chlorococcum tatrense]AYQ94370.1 protochlorophyllide reductase subunit B [Chlorococcum tatrense]
MKLAYWMYAGPAHIGTLRVASSFKNVHAIMHAPLGDDYFNVMRSMLERERDFTPVTASIVDRHVLARGSQEKVVENITRKDKEERPDLILLTPTCTSSILQEDLQNFVNRASNEAVCDVILADVNHYRVNELQAADRTLEQIVRFYIEKEKKNQEKEGCFSSEGVASLPLFEQGGAHNFIWSKTEKPSANILGIFTLGFHNQHDCKELKKLLNDLHIEINEVLPEGGDVNSLKNLPKAWFNIVPYREVGLMTAIYLEKEFKMPYTSITPMGLVDTAAFIREIASICKKIVEERSSDSKNPNSFAPASSLPKILDKNQYENYIDKQTHFVSQAAWFSRSIDCQNLTGKKTVVFGDATHAASMTKILVREMGIHVVCAGTYCKHDADWFREQVSGYCDQVLITDDHSQIGEIIAKLEPAAIFGTQMERHVGKRLDIPCGVISAPVHIQNFPLGFRPFLGYEGTNQISDLVYNSFSLGMEDHLLEIFNGHDNKEVVTRSYSSENESQNEWTKEALTELSKVPGFVRSKVKRNTEKYAESIKARQITVEIMYAAKEAVQV